MLAIRMQRTGRKGHAMFRVIVQDSRRTPTSGDVVAQLGSYDPHAKTLIMNKDKASFYLDHGAQPSDRVARLLKNDGVKLPAWVRPAADKQRAIRNTEKRRSTRPPNTVEEKVEAPVADEVPVTAKPAPEATPEEVTVPTEETPASTEEATTVDQQDQSIAEEKPTEDNKTD